MSRPAHRVLAINRAGHLGGVERIILTLADALRDSGWHTTLACPDAGALSAAAAAQGIDVAASMFDRMRITADPRLLARYPRAWLRGAEAVERHCRDRRIDIIHAHHPVSALYAIRASRRLGIPLVLHVHETLPAKPLYALAMRIALCASRAVMCVSGAALALARSMGADPNCTSVVYNGVDPRFLGALPEPEPKVAQEGPGPHIGLFGVLEPRKAQHVFLEAATLLCSRFPEARFWLVGPAALRDKQDYADRVRAIADAPALRGRAILTGFQANVAAWIAAMDVVAQSSVASESFGMSLAEALALGRPVVATNVGGMPEVVRDGRTGFIVRPNDATAFAEAIATLLTDPAARAQFGKDGASDARARFSPTVFQRSVAQVYEAVLGTVVPSLD